MSSLYQKCIDAARLDLLREWDAEKNQPLGPWNVSSGSHKRVWWRCEQGHEWQAPVYNRWAGHGCPFCSGQRVRQGVNDLRTRFPELAAEWNSEKNGDLTPEHVTPGSAKTVWWRCDRGHEWQAPINTRARFSAQCPICANKTVRPWVNDLQSQCPEVAASWHPEKNGSLTPQDVGTGSRKRVWWRCEKGHEWRAEVASRVSGSGCPVCSGRTVIPGENDLASVSPSLASQWHPTKNGDLTPDMIRPQSNRLVWWRCGKGHEWRAKVTARLNGNGCPYCANKKVLPGYNDLATLEPQIAGQWAQDLNGVLTPQTVSRASHVKAWWRCAEGHVWQAKVYSRTGSQRSGCPVCAGSVSKRMERKLPAERVNRGREALHNARIDL